jgi:NAD(P)-dependent dehydrogenase (short-subunit alcohol dehydrogenase family)
MDTSLKGKVAYITGASSGIGLKLVLYFLSKGYVCVPNIYVPLFCRLPRTVDC